ncbi:uncharacterized protein [Temnothorax nylanderi]|uniref:uncharacterized protein isoform X2 n=1 Tax=Temnothorax nylanderi TaxID=102681 RepID=UPI003A8C1D9B
MENHKKKFFVIRLQSAQAVSLNDEEPIQDPDPVINCDLMDGRDAFLTMARKNHYEYSSLRRAKFSSMYMLYKLHNQGQDKFVAVMNTSPTGPVAAMQAGQQISQQMSQQTLQQLMQQQQQQQHQPQPMATGAQMPRQPGVMGPVRQVGPQASNMQKHAPQQLMQTLRSPHTPGQQNQILQIPNPPLMAAFIDQRQQPGQHGEGVGGPLDPNQPQQQQQPGLQHMMSQHQQQQQQGRCCRCCNSNNSSSSSRTESKYSKYPIHRL